MIKRNTLFILFFISSLFIQSKHNFCKSNPTYRTSSPTFMLSVWSFRLLCWPSLPLWQPTAARWQTAAARLTKWWVNADDSCSNKAANTNQQHSLDPSWRMYYQCLIDGLSVFFPCFLSLSACDHGASPPCQSTVRRWSGWAQKTATYKCYTKIKLH